MTERIPRPKPIDPHYMRQQFLEGVKQADPATELAGRKVPCPGHPSHPCRPCRGVDEDGEYEHTLCGGTGLVFLFDNTVRPPCPQQVNPFFNGTDHVQWYSSNGQNCPYCEGRTWQGSRDMEVWVKAIWKAYPTKVIILTPPGIPRGSVPGEFIVMGDDPLEDLLQSVEQLAIEQAVK